MTYEGEVCNAHFYPNPVVSGAEPIENYNACLNSSKSQKSAETWISGTMDSNLKKVTPISVKAWFLVQSQFKMNAYFDKSNYLRLEVGRGMVFK